MNRAAVAPDHFRLQEEFFPSVNQVFEHPGQSLPDVMAEVFSACPEESFYFFNERELARRAALLLERFLPHDDRARPAYAVKANPHPRVLQVLTDVGITAFDCASLTEVQQVRSYQPEADIFFNNPNKKRREIREACRLGVRHFTADTKNEVNKIISLHAGGDSASFALENIVLLPHNRIPTVTLPQPELAIRLATPNEKGAGIDLSEKYGASRQRVLALLRRVYDTVSMQPGISVHIGSQNEDERLYDYWFREAAGIVSDLRAKLHTFNVGGGIPVLPYASLRESEQVFCSHLESICAALDAHLLRYVHDDGKVIIEPGRALVGPSIDLAIAIINFCDEGEIPVIVMDDGIFTSFSDAAIHDWTYDIRVVDAQGREVTGPKVKCHLYGRTCDSGDCLKEVLLPRDIRPDHYLWVPNAGAYMSSQATQFNGFSPHRYVRYNLL